MYLPTERLLILFRRVSGNRFADREYECLRTDTVQAILSECGAASNLRPIKFENERRFSAAQREEMRIRSHENSGFSREERLQDWQLTGLERILVSFDDLEVEERIQASTILWGALSELDRESFEGEYSWYYYSSRSCKFDSWFIDLLNKTSWVATQDGGLKPPAT